MYTIIYKKLIKRTIQNGYKHNWNVSFDRSVNTSPNFERNTQKKGIDTTTLQEIQHKAELKKQKYIEKQCAKHNIEINKE